MAQTKLERAKKKAAAEAAKKKALAELKAYTESLVPQDIHEGVKCY